MKEGEILPREIPVNQLDYYTGKPIDSYKSMAEAANDNYIDVKYFRRALKSKNGILAYKKLRFEVAR